MEQGYPTGVAYVEMRRSANVRSLPIVWKSRLGRQPLHSPFPAFSLSIPQTIVKAVFTMLPEFHTVRYKTITTPVPGQRYGSPGERLSEMSEFSGQEFSRWNNLGLFRYGSGDLREPWARLEVLLGFVSADRLHRSLDAHLPAQVRPVKNQR